MKNTVIFFLVFLFFTNTLHAQSAAEVDSIVKRYPKQYSSTEKLAARIQTDFSTEYARARAVYSWIAFNIRYDVKSYLHPKKNKAIQYTTEAEKQQKLKAAIDKKISKVLRKGKGVCGGYALLFERVASQVGLQANYINGDGKTKNYEIGKRRAVVDHAWNSVKIDGTWRLLDVTWGAGTVDEEEEKFYAQFNPFYFDTEPKLFFAQHYPKTGVWEGSEIAKSEFLKSPLTYAVPNEKYQIIEPKQGIIEVCKDDKVVFKILNATEDTDVRYSLRKNDTTVEVATKTQKDNVLEFEITIDKTIGRYLSLYVNGIGIATFKVTILK
ncbi:transglutaminase domain-containing protein [Flavobacterium sp.]|uniref:transglutaminase domain-containing protein n=1 Tax=Flavobacterium sp. TaxID=239 RepID=UPI002FD93D20